MLSLNGSLLVHTCTASLAAQVSSGDTFTQADVYTACGCCAHLDAGLQHAWPLLQALGAVPATTSECLLVGGPTLQGPAGGGPGPVHSDLSR